MTTLHQALQSIQSIPPLQTTIAIPLFNALKMVTAIDIIATINNPRYDNSAMDGYAILHDDIDTPLTLQETIYAGSHTTNPILPKHTIKIMTGATIPPNTQTIIPLENTTIQNNHILVTKPVKLGANIRRAGEDIAQSSLLIPKGTRLGSYHIPLLLSQNITQITIYKPLSILVLSSGDELHANTIVDTNSAMLSARLQEWGCEVSTITLRDDEQSIKQALLTHVDLIITTGGASIGDKDCIKSTLATLGIDWLFDKIDIKPGKPTSLGRLPNGTYVFVLPGNPLACMVNFELLGKHLICRLANLPTPTIHTATAKQEIASTVKDLVILGNWDTNEWKPLALQMPNMLSPLPLANSLAIIHKDQNTIHQGDTLPIYLID